MTHGACAVAMQLARLTLSWFTLLTAALSVALSLLVLRNSLDPTFDWSTLLTAASCLCGCQTHLELVHSLDSSIMFVLGTVSISGLPFMGLLSIAQMPNPP